jgi:hypothetical protein
VETGSREENAIKKQSPGFDEIKAGALVYEDGKDFVAAIGDGAEIPSRRRHLLPARKPRVAAANSPNAL